VKAPKYRTHFLTLVRPAESFFDRTVVIIVTATVAETIMITSIVWGFSYHWQSEDIGTVITKPSYENLKG
jgi:hypothetical protein